MPAEKGSGRTGTFVCGGDTFALAVQDLPTIVESYKTYDDIHLVKSTDIGQVRLSAADLHACMQAGFNRWPEKPRGWRWSLLRNDMPPAYRRGSRCACDGSSGRLEVGSVTVQ